MLLHAHVDSGSFRSIQHAEGQPALVGDAPHQSVQRINLAHENAFADSANTRVARHFANSFKLLCEQSSARASTSSSCGSFATSVSTACMQKRAKADTFRSRTHDDDIEHWSTIHSGGMR